MANQYTKRKETEARLREKAERQELAGIPDSKPPIDLEAVQENRLAGCHVKGVPVEDLPPELQAHLRWEITDEGLAAQDRDYQAKMAAGQVSRITVESDAATERKRFGAMGDRLAAGAPIELAQDPMRELMTQHLKSDEAGRWMDPQVVDALGMRGFETVLDANGNKVTCGQSFLAKRPKAVDEARQAHKDRVNDSKITAMQDKISEQVGQLSHAQKQAGVPVGVTGAPHSAGLHISRDLEELASRRQQ